MNEAHAPLPKTLCDEFALLAAEYYLNNSKLTFGQVAKASYDFADFMIAEREKISEVPSSPNPRRLEYADDTIAATIRQHINNIKKKYTIPFGAENYSELCNAESRGVMIAMNELESRLNRKEGK